MSEINTCDTPVMDMSDPDALKLLDIVSHYYSEPHRYYHNNDHIFQGLLFAKKYLIELTVTEFIAWVFHDVVYIPGNTNNEELSAELMLVILRNNNIAKYNHLLDDVTKIILSTKYQYKNNTDDVKLLHSINKIHIIDYSVFFGKYEDFVSYDNAIKKEFSLVAKYSTSEYASGRKKFLKSILQEFKTTGLKYDGVLNTNILVCCGICNLSTILHTFPAPKDKESSIT